ncbi:MAG: hypothetical protein WCK63_09590 [Betaproteobacteria bacterium]
MTLAALALMRSVDTTTIISGNLAFKQSATASSDTGVESAITWLAGIQAANNTKNVLTDATHPFNISNTANAANGYYSNADPALNLTADATWVDASSKLVGTDTSGNTTRFIIQRLCRTANQPIQSASCLFSGELVDNNGQQVRLPQETCNGSGCPVAGQSPQIRITTRTTGPRNTVSYIQAFVY